MKIRNTILTWVLCFLTFATIAQDAGTLIVEIGSFRNDDGVVLIAIHSGEEGFPGEEGTVVMSSKATIKDGKAHAEFQNLAYGEYAISVFHDENSNDELDTNWIGIPKEGVGASNNAKGKMGSPKYEDAKFNFEKDQQKMEFDIDYIF